MRLDPNNNLDVAQKTAIVLWQNKIIKSFVLHSLDVTSVQVNPMLIIIFLIFYHQLYLFSTSLRINAAQCALQEGNLLHGVLHFENRHLLHKPLLSFPLSTFQLWPFSSIGACLELKHNLFWNFSGSKVMKDPNVVPVSTPPPSVYTNNCNIQHRTTGVLEFRDRLHSCLYFQPKIFNLYLDELSSYFIQSEIKYVSASQWGHRDSSDSGSSPAKAGRGILSSLCTFGISLTQWRVCVRICSSVVMIEPQLPKLNLRDRTQNNVWIRVVPFQDEEIGFTRVCHLFDCDSDVNKIFMYTKCMCTYILCILYLYVYFN